MRRGVIGLCILALLVSVGPAFGQAQRGTISVTVASEDGSRRPGATVSAESDETLSRRTAVTDAQGVATLTALDPAANYVVTTSLDGFNTVRNESVLVRAGQNTPLSVTLGLATVREELIVTAEAPVVDVTSAVTGEDITLQLTESLPTARSYQDYLQLVPGVLPSDSGNPASRSGLNYSDIGGDVGTSTDNFYYFEGINVTDGVSGTFGANLNTEIIQEQSVLTGGIPAEYAGAPGLISNVITKSGGNRLSGSVNYYFQDDNLVEANEHAGDSSFSTFDTAVTLGGPVVRDQAWFFGSFRRVEREEDVADPQTGELLRTPTQEADQGFAKLTWAPTHRDLVSGLFLSDPQERDGSFNNQNSNARDTRREQGGERWSVSYSRVWEGLTFEAAVTEHAGDLDDFPTVAGIRNDVAFPEGSDPSLSEGQLGGFGRIFIEERGTEAARASAEYFIDTGWGDHTLKAGVESSEYSDFRDDRFAGDPPALYTSLTDRLLGQRVTARDVATGFDRVEFDPSVQDDYTGLLEAIAGSGDPQKFLDLLDADRDGTISQAEVLDNLVFDSTAGNPHGQLNYYRELEVARGVQDTSSEGRVAFVQDTWQQGRWSVNAGLRAEEWEHFATTGDGIFTFDWEVAPRLSAAYDLGGDGRQRVSLFYGRYYDPIRNNLTNFAGTLTGQRTEEQVFIGGEWLTYRFRGGATQQDAVFTPTTQTPYTDELQLGYKADLGRNMSVEANLIHRRAADLIEDFFLELYADPAVYPGPVDHPDSLFLGLDYFGLDSFPPNVNFFIGTLPGAEREYDGVELIFRKRFGNNWQALASYNYADVTGSSNSDSAADFAGDVLFLDPRAPNVRGRQPGSIEHLLKLQGSYSFDNGVTLGGAYRWNSGSAASRTFLAADRHLPIRVTTPFEFAGITNTRWVAPDTVGVLTNPDFGLLDLRAAYLWQIGQRLEADLFVDVFNVLDEQEAVRLQDLVAGQPGFPFGAGLEFNDPRRYFLGARLRF
mgnify:CR=1 FL=1